jgi:hypothetical protein
MSFRKKVIANKPKVALESITTLIVAGYKGGKTHLYKQLTELHYENPDHALLLAFEDGYETWELDNVLPLHAEGTDENLWKVWEYFKKTITPDLVKEAKEGRITKLLGVDTADRAIDACTAWVIRDRSTKYAKKFTSLQDISDKTNENGWTALYEELKKPFDTLKNAGYGFIHLAWTKEKETTLYDGKKYNSIQLMMNNTAKKVFESQASLICCIQNEVDVLDKNGNVLEENIKDKKGRELASNFRETSQVMYFRPSGFVECAGGRYENLPEKVPFGGENFLKVFEDAVTGQLKKTDSTVEELKTEQEIARDEKAQTVEVEQELTAEDLFVEINDKVAGMTGQQKTKVAKLFNDSFGDPNYKLHEGDLTKLKIVAKHVDTVLNA